MLDLRDRLLAQDGVIIRELEYGGNTKEELLGILTKSGISLNEYAHALFSSDLFKIALTKQHASVIELAIQDLGIEKEATLGTIFEKAKAFSLSLCPLEIGPYLRLRYIDQKEEKEVGKNKAPKGSITVISKPLEPDNDTFPKGFYIRKIDGILWLRGYSCSMDYVWDVKDRIALML